MIAFYEPNNFAIIHLVTQASDEYMTWLTNPATQHQFPFVIVDDLVPYDEIEILPGGRWQRRVPISVTAPATGMVGETIIITDVPAGVEVQVNSSPAGTMDASGVLELFLAVGGRYTIRFSGSGYITKDLTIEAQPVS